MTTRIKTTTVADQIILHLKDAFLEGKYYDGQQLPAVADLAEQMGVGISSMREALKKLEALGWVEIIHGRGIYVRTAKLQWQAKFTSFSETVRTWGKVPGAKLLDSGLHSAPMDVAVQLGLCLGSPVYYLRRLRLADGEPIAIETAYLDAERFPGLLEVYQDPRSLYQLLQVEYNVRLVAGLQTIEAVAVNTTDSEVLSVPIGSPALLVSTIAYDIKSVPVEYGLSLFRSDKYRYVVKLMR
jgi:GntR family transcriptional regulator